MVRNYKKKTDKEYAWKVPRVRTWDAKKPKEEKPQPEDDDWNGVEEYEDGYPLDDHIQELRAVLDYCRKHNIN